jgi:hypothetical protein
MVSVMAFIKVVSKPVVFAAASNNNPPAPSCHRIDVWETVQNVFFPELLDACLQSEQHGDG